jgi:hypothetical protein
VDNATSYTDAIGQLLRGSEKTKLDRLELLIGNGMNPAEALITDEAAMRAVKEIGGVIGRNVDELSPAFQINAMLYIMRVVVENMDKLEDVLNQMVIITGLERGIPIIAAGGEALDCPCPGCTAARESRRRTLN